jgi:hypothetical protein
MVDLYYVAGRLDRAEAEWDEWLPRVTMNAIDRDLNETQGFGSRRGEVLLRRRRFAEAEPYILKGYDFMKSHQSWICPVFKDRLPDAELVIRLYEAWGQVDESKVKKAAAWRARLAIELPLVLPEDVFLRL